MKLKQLDLPARWVKKLEPMPKCLVVVLALILTCQGKVFSQQARFFAYQQGYSNYYFVEQPLGTPHMELRQIIGDTIVNNSIWHRMKTTASGNGQSGSLFWFVRAHDTIIDGRPVTIDSWTRDFVSVRLTEHYLYPADTVVNDSRIQSSSNCKEFKAFGISDSCLSIAIIRPTSKSLRTYSKQRGLVYSVDSILVVENPARYYLELYLPSRALKKENPKNNAILIDRKRYYSNGAKHIHRKNTEKIWPLY